MHQRGEERRGMMEPDVVPSYPDVAEGDEDEEGKEEEVVGGGGGGGGGGRWSGMGSTILGLGKKAAIAVAALTSAPVVVPPLFLCSAVGLAFAVPFGIFYAGVACTDKLMQTILPFPSLLSQEEEEGEKKEIPEEEEEEKEVEGGKEGKEMEEEEEVKEEQGKVEEEKREEEGRRVTEAKEEKEVEGEREGEEVEEEEVDKAERGKVEEERREEEGRRTTESEEEKEVKEKEEVKGDGGTTEDENRWEGEGGRVTDSEERATSARSFEGDVEDQSTAEMADESKSERSAEHGSEPKAEPSDDEGLYSEEKIWEQISALRIIIGYKADLNSSCVEELRALYYFTGVEPPVSLKDPFDPMEVKDKLCFLKSLIGVG